MKLTEVVNVAKRSRGQAYELTEKAVSFTLHSSGGFGEA